MPGELIVNAAGPELPAATATEIPAETPTTPATPKTAPISIVFVSPPFQNTLELQ